jgi:hypothetical protein
LVLLLGEVVQHQVFVRRGEVTHRDAIAQDFDLLVVHQIEELVHEDFFLEGTVPFDELDHELQSGVEFDEETVPCWGLVVRLEGHVEDGVVPAVAHPLSQHVQTEALDLGVRFEPPFQNCRDVFFAHGRFLRVLHGCKTKLQTRLPSLVLT